MKKGSLFVLLLLMLAGLALAVWLLLLPKGQPAPTAAAVTVPTLTEQETAAVTELVTEPVTTVPETTEDPMQRTAESLLDGMTEWEKLCQLMILSPDTLAGVSPVTKAGDTMKNALAQYPVGGFSFGQNNIRNREQITELLNGLQACSDIDLFFCLDEEGGTVWRVMGNDNMDTTRVDSMYAYKDEGGEVAYENAKTIAQDISALGFSVDFAPVSDVWSNPDNTVIGKRAYSDSFTQAAELVSQAVKGFHDGGVACTVKHFPGHGCTVQDSHKGLAIVDRTEEELRENELLPFKAGIEAGADLVMVGHLQVDAFDTEYPATLSYKIVTQLLREELGFDGVVITDSLGMGALDNYTETEKCVLALNAGCDILLGVRSPKSTLAGLQSALADGTLTMERVNESVLRILTLKISRGLIPLDEG